MTPGGRVAVGRSALHGRGVFATLSIPAGGMIEVSPVLVVPAEHVEDLRRTALWPYCFGWPGDRSCIALGTGSLYNHSPDANARVTLNSAAGLVSFSATRSIAVGEEITINYNGEPDDPTPVCFDEATWAADAEGQW